MEDIIRVNKRDDAVEKTKKLGTKLPKGKKLAKVLVVLVLLGLAGLAGWLYKQNRDLKANPSAAQNEKNKAETSRVLDKLKEDLLVQETEAPTVARVEDPEKLKSSNAEFYKNIQKGDYLVIFPKRAIIYREANRQIINIAPIINTSDLKTTGTQPASTSTPSTTNKATTTR